MEENLRSDDEYQVTFRNGAYKKIQELADKLGVSFEEVLEKGLKALELPDDDKLIFKQGGETFFIDIRKL